MTALTWLLSLTNALLVIFVVTSTVLLKRCITRLRRHRKRANRRFLALYRAKQLQNSRHPLNAAPPPSWLVRPRASAGPVAMTAAIPQRPGA